MRERGKLISFSAFPQPTVLFYFLCLTSDKVIGELLELMRELGGDE